MSAPHPDAPEWPLACDNDLDPTVVQRLCEADTAADEAGSWPEALWQVLVANGAPGWSLPEGLGGSNLDRGTLLRRYARVAEGSLTAAFILSQHDAAVRRLVAANASGQGVANRWLREIADGRSFATVGISQLTTSRRHGTRALVATERPGGGYRLDGAMPWVTAAPRADVFVTGAVLDDDRQVLIALPAHRDGLRVREPFALAALQASCTCEVACEDVVVEEC